MNPARLPVGQPPLEQLLAGYLEQQAAAHAEGTAFAEPPGEVVPFDAGSVQPLDPKLAWTEAVAVLRTWQPRAPEPPVPPDWPALVAAHEPAAALAFCAANFPQLVRELQPLLHATDLASLRPAGALPLSLPTLREWAARQQGWSHILFAAGVLRLARQFDAAGELLHDRRLNVPAEWQAAWANEEAALAWHVGRHEEAAALWQGQPATLPVLFNRGMAALFGAQRADARRCLTQALAQLPEDSGWHHLASLYLALAEQS